MTEEWQGRRCSVTLLPCPSSESLHPPPLSFLWVTTSSPCVSIPSSPVLPLGHYILPPCQYTSSPVLPLSHYTLLPCPSSVSLHTLFPCSSSGSLHPPPLSFLYVTTPSSSVTTSSSPVLPLMLATSHFYCSICASLLVSIMAECFCFFDGSFIVS